MNEGRVLHRRLSGPRRHRDGARACDDSLGVVARATGIIRNSEGVQDSLAPLLGTTGPGASPRPLPRDDVGRLAQGRRIQPRAWCR